MSDKKRHNDQILGQWVETQRGRPQYRAAPSAGLSVSKVMRPLARKHGGGSSAIALEKIWPEVMGPRWSKISAPVRFLGGRHGRTLIISAPGPAASLILAQSGPIIQRLNAHLGSGHISRIKVVQSRMTKPARTQPSRGLAPRQEMALRDGLSDIKSERLKQALEKMGRQVLSKDQSK
ncbi:MAG: DciA family protein [Litorimonas sp.]